VHREDATPHTGMLGVRVAGLGYDAPFAPDGKTFRVLRTVARQIVAGGTAVADGVVPQNAVNRWALYVRAGAADESLQLVVEKQTWEEGEEGWVTLATTIVELQVRGPRWERARARPGTRLWNERRAETRWAALAWRRRCWRRARR
jgi:hypothetical protein